MWCNYQVMNRVFAGAAMVLVLSAGSAHAQPSPAGPGGPGWVLSHQKISDTQGGGPPLRNSDQFGVSVVSLGDLDRDGVGDLAVGSYFDDDGGEDRGAVWVLFLNTDGTVETHQKISNTQGGFTGILDDGDWFGTSVASLGDLDGDGVGDLAVGAVLDDDGGLDHGALWILFLNTDGTVKSHQKISNPETGPEGDDDAFGRSVASLDDLDGDGVGDLAVGAFWDDDGGFRRGAVWMFFLNTDGTVKSQQKISDTHGGFSGILDNEDYFGTSVAALGDLDGDGVADLAVGAFGDDDGGKPPNANHGAVWVLFLNPNGTVKSHQKISHTEGGFTGILDDSDSFSCAASLPDLDGDGVGDLAVGAWHDGGFDRGAVWILLLNTDGTVKCPDCYQKINDTQGGGPPLDNGDLFGVSVASLGDLDRDGVGDLAVGALRDDDGGFGRGAVWVLFLDGICLWDLDANGSVGVSDLLSLLASWGPCKGCPADFDGNDDVGVSDLLALLANWGPCP